MLTGVAELLEVLGDVEQALSLADWVSANPETLRSILNRAEQLSQRLHSAQVHPDESIPWRKSKLPQVITHAIFLLRDKAALDKNASEPGM
jgi:hypothetical protein